MTDIAGAEPVRQIERAAEGVWPCWCCCSALQVCRRCWAFFGKFYVLKAAVDAGMVSGWRLAGAVASVIGAFYYLRLVYFMYFGVRGGAARKAAWSPAQWLALVACGCDHAAWAS